MEGLDVRNLTRLIQERRTLAIVPIFGRDEPIEDRDSLADMLPMIRHGSLGITRHEQYDGQHLERPSTPATRLRN